MQHCSSIIHMQFASIPVVQVFESFSYEPVIGPGTRRISRIYTRRLELGTRDGLSEALLSLLPVDDVPDGLEVLYRTREHSRHPAEDE